MTRSDIRELELQIARKERKINSFRHWFSTIKNMPENKGKKFPIFDNHLEKSLSSLADIKQELVSANKSRKI